MKRTKRVFSFFFVVVQEGMERAMDWWMDREMVEKEKMMELIDIAGVLIKASVE